MYNQWFRIERVKSHIILLQESLELIDSRFLTKQTNIFLIIGSHGAILFDTGSGCYPIKDEVLELIGDKALFVINSHNHFDHLGNNSEFDQIYIHTMDLKIAANTMDVTFLKSSDSDYLFLYQKQSFAIQPCKEIIPLIGNEEFDLGDLQVKVIYTPGHTSGSICLLTDRDELFTGDTYHKGSYYLPPFERFKNLIDSLEELTEIITTQTEIFPAHEGYMLDSSDIPNFVKILKTIKLDNDDTVFDEFLDAYILKLDAYNLIYPKEGYIDKFDW